MARITKATRDTIVAATNEFLTSINESEEVELEFGVKDDAVNNELKLVCKKSSKSSDLKRSIEYKDGTINVNAGQELGGE